MHFKCWKFLKTVELGYFPFCFQIDQGRAKPNPPERLLCLKMNINLNFSKITGSSGSSASHVANSSGHVTLTERHAEMRPAILIPL